jgi:hypothetical protein
VAVETAGDCLRCQVVNLLEKHGTPAATMLEALRLDRRFVRTELPQRPLQMNSAATIMEKPSDPEPDATGPPGELAARLRRIPDYWGGS